MISNNVLTTLSANVLVGANSISVVAASAPDNSPPDPAGAIETLTLVDSISAPTKREIITYTGRTGTGPYTLTGVTKGTEGTTDQAWNAGDVVYMALTAAQVNAAGGDMLAANNLSDIVDPLTALANLNGTPLGASFNVQTGTTYTLVASDMGKVLQLNNASPITLTVPGGLGPGFNCSVIQVGAGQITTVASGSTIHNRQGYTKTAGQFSIITLLAYDTTNYILQGDAA